MYHSLQVFDLARDELPYDEEFLLAALLHDVGKAIDRHDHVTAGLEALAEHITPRTAWFIAHHMEGQELLDGGLGVRARRRLEASEDYEELKLLARCDRNGRQCGVETPGVGRSDRVSSRVGGKLRGVRQQPPQPAQRKSAVGWKFPLPNDRILKWLSYCW